MKPTVNIKIHYRGINYSKINELSGGEIDRISLVITLALNKMSSIPVILLDEVLSSLDMNAKESCLSIVKSYSNMKTILTIDHEGVEGYYDAITTIE